MANKKITELNGLTSADSADVLPIVDISANETKKITYLALFPNILVGKRITKRVVTATDTTSITPNSDNCDVLYQANTQVAGTLTINADTGTGTEGQLLLIKIKSTNIQTFAWNAQYHAGYLPIPISTTGAGLTDYYSFIWDSNKSCWNFTGASLGN